MEFNLPKLTTDVDCAPLGYPGLVFTFWLNPTTLEAEWEPPKEPEPWERLWYVAYARVLLSVTIPGAFAGSGEDKIIDPVDAKTVYELDHTPGFESSILLWVFNTWNEERQERYKVALKN